MLTILPTTTASGVKEPIYNGKAQALSHLDRVINLPTISSSFANATNRDQAQAIAVYKTEFKEKLNEELTQALTAIDSQNQVLGIDPNAGQIRSDIDGIDAMLAEAAIQDQPTDAESFTMLDRDGLKASIQESNEVNTRLQQHQSSDVKKVAKLNEQVLQGLHAACA